jgi:hypothetical protein
MTAGTFTASPVGFTRVQSLSMQCPMALFYISIPFMILGVAIAVVPLLFAIRHDARLSQYAGVATALPETSGEALEIKAS